MLDLSKVPKRSWIAPHLEIAASSIHGSGIFTQRAIEKAEVVIIWGGEIVTLDEFRGGKGLRHTNVGIDENLYLVSSSTATMGIDDYINHSCDPNLWLEDEFTLIARRDIKAGEELTIDYAIELLDEKYVMKNICNCRTLNCRRTITGNDWRLPEVQRAERGHFSPFLNRRIEKLVSEALNSRQKDKRMKILVTGGSRGIGRAIAEELAQSGHELLLVARNAERLDKAAKDIASGSRVAVAQCVCDVGQTDQLKALRGYCDKIGFLPSVLVLDAGIFIEGSLAQSKAEDFSETLNVNFVSIYHTVQLFFDALKAQKPSKVILIGSTAAYEAYPIGPLYGVAKWALRGYAANLRRELMKEGIGVTFLAPGGTLTDLWAGEELPPNRLLEPRDVGKLVAAILTLSDQAVVEELIVRPMLGDIHE